MRASPVAIAISVSVLCVAALAQTPVDLYRRIVPLETTTGVVTIRSAVSRQLDVPEPCRDGSMKCSATRRFGRVYSIEFEVETRRSTAQETFVEREPRGTVYLALAATQDEEESYDDILRERLGLLAAAAFDEAFAGLRPDRQPFDGPVAERSVEPSWSCFTRDGAASATIFSRTVTPGKDGSSQTISGTSMSTYEGAEIADPLCATLDEATATAHSEAVRTMPAPRRVIEEALRVDVANSLLEKAHADQLLPLPEGSELLRRRAPGVQHSTSGERRNDIIKSRLTLNEVEIAAVVMPARLPPAAARDNAWHSRWTFGRSERRFGPLPESRLLEEWSLTVSLLPTAPPQDLDRTADDGVASDSEGPYPVRFDERALFESVAGALDFSEAISPPILADTIVQKVAGLHAPGWVLVICPEESPASWGLAPTLGRALLLNADDFCGTVESYLP